MLKHPRGKYKPGKWEEVPLKIKLGEYLIWYLYRITTRIYG